MNSGAYLIKRATSGFGANLGASLEALRLLAAQEQAKKRERKQLRRQSYTSQLHTLENSLRSGRPLKTTGFDQRMAIPQ